ncbi:Uncharacterised protein [Burkholderia pseudomallei]|nr:Uncharacterised protein [Burkholderia pseudomallei]
MPRCRAVRRPCARRRRRQACSACGAGAPVRLPSSTISAAKPMLPAAIAAAVRGDHQIAVRARIDERIGIPVDQRAAHERIAEVCDRKRQPPRELRPIDPHARRDVQPVEKHRDRYDSMQYPVRIIRRRMMHRVQMREQQLVDDARDRHVQHDGAARGFVSSRRRLGGEPQARKQHDRRVQAAELREVAEEVVEPEGRRVPSARDAVAGRGKDQPAADQSVGCDKSGFLHDGALRVAMKRASWRTSARLLEY